MKLLIGTQRKLKVQSEFLFKIKYQVSNNVLNCLRTLSISPPDDLRKGRGKAINDKLGIPKLLRDAHNPLLEKLDP